LKLDAVQDYTIVNIFQGHYLTIESPERERVAYQDFLALQDSDKAINLRVLPERISLGRPAHSDSIVELSSLDKANPGATGPKEQEMPAFFQTKSGFSIDSLHPPSASPSTQSQRPASIVLVATLIDNPTNLGGLSRISESFGLEALYIDDLKKMAHKDFKATSVTSEKHLPIYELKVPKLPTFLLDMKRSGYQVVGIEQTDQSGVLGTEVGEATETRNLGTLPKRCVLVLGSEKGGITAEVLAVVDRCVEIRTVGVTRSLSKCDIE
jgi:tRNA guanosine-2'-O-methyltransferase